MLDCELRACPAIASCRAVQAGAVAEKFSVQARYVSDVISDVENRTTQGYRGNTAVEVGNAYLAARGADARRRVEAHHDVIIEQEKIIYKLGSACQTGPRGTENNPVCTSPKLEETRKSRT